MNRTIQTKWIALLEHVYRALLVLYPADYRREYGSLMVQLFRDVCREKLHRHGFTGLAYWWCKTLFDLALTALEQRRKVSFVMSKSTFMQLTGIFLMVGGAFSAVAAFSQFQPDDHYTYYGIYQLLLLAMVPGFLCIGIGCIGLGLRPTITQTLGTVGRWALYISGLAALVMAAGIGAMSIDNSMWNLWMGGFVVHIIALTAFGLLHLWKPVLPIFCALPLQIAAGLLIMGSGVLPVNSLTTKNLLSFLFIFGMGLAWLGIGAALNRQQRQATLITA